MARGWESKSVEAQVESAQEKTELRRAMTVEEAARHRRMETLRLSRARVLQELQAAQDPRYIKLLNDTLADLERRVSELK